MKRLLVCITAVLTAQLASAQIDFGINLKGGIGEMKKIPYTGEIVYLNEIESEAAETWGLSFIASKKIHPIFAISAELGYNNIKGVEKEVYHMHFIDGSPSIINTAETIRDVHYVSLPISANLRIAPKVWLGGGFSANYIVTNSRTTTYRANDMPSGILSGGNDLNRFDFGLHGQASIELSEKFTLLGKANFGLLNIRKPGTRDALNSINGFPFNQEFEVKNRQYTIGITYNLIKK